MAYRKKPSFRRTPYQFRRRRVTYLRPRARINYRPMMRRRR